MLGLMVRGLFAGEIVIATTKGRSMDQVEITAAQCSTRRRSSLWILFRRSASKMSKSLESFHCQRRTNQISSRIERRCSNLRKMWRTIAGRSCPHPPLIIQPSLSIQKLAYSAKIAQIPSMNSCRWAAQAAGQDRPRH